ncbi:MAG: HAD family hydrolase [Patescibacteria group bacterium]
MIRHVWFDFSYTIAFPAEEMHKKLLYDTYAEVVGKEVSEELIEEYKTLFAKAKSNSGVFTALGKNADFWSERLAAVDPKILFRLGSPDIPSVLATLKERVPISIWSNIYAARVLPALGIETSWFTNILGPDDVKNPKPALDGFNMIIERSALPPEEILFVGDSVEKEMIPAKSVGLQTGIMWTSSPEADYSFGGFQELLEVVK